MAEKTVLSLVRSGWSFAQNGCFLNSGVSLEVNGELINWNSDMSKTMSGIDSSEGSYKGYIGTMETSGLILTLTALQFNESGYITQQLKIENRTESAITLGKCSLFSGDITLDGGRPAVLKQSGWVIDNDVRSLREGETISSKTFSLLLSRETCKSIPLCFLTFDRATTAGELTLIHGQIKGTLYCDFEGFSLLPGAVQNSETLYIAVESDPFAAAEHWAERVARHYQPVFNPTPSVGWIGGWTWRCGFTQELYEDLIIENIAAIEKKLTGFGVKNIWMSIANYKDMVPGNWLEHNRERFPHGWEWIFERIREKKMSPGFWIAPFWVPDKLSPTAERMKDCLLKKDGKAFNNGYHLGYGLSQTLPPEERVSFRALDPSNPDAVAYLKEVFTELHRLGVRYYMIDFLHVASGTTPGHFPYDEYYDTAMVKGPEVYRNGLKAIRESAGADTWLLSSTGTLMQNIGCVDAVRIGCDFGEGRPLYPEMPFYPAMCMTDDFELLKKVLWSFAASFFTNRRFYHNDAFNVMTVDKPVPRNEAEIVASFFALSSGPVMLGDDIATIDEERLAMVKKVLPQYDRSAVAADLFDTDYPDYPKVYVLPVEKGWESYRVVGLLNFADEPLSVEFPLEKAGLTGGEYTLFDFWNARYCGKISNTLTASVPPRSIKVYKIAPVREHP
ncbi:MAG TPA: hypothetical protein PKH29_09525, partial [Oscillospiraceae bacterium]|nr:hypothetical protein [Oscillospiraceae bacterium]